MFRSFHFLALCSLGAGCFPLDNGNDGDEIGDNVISSTPSFQIIYYPPIEWTAPADNGTPEPGQAPDVDIATEIAHRMVAGALLNATVRAGILPPSDMTYDWGDFEGQAINVTTNRSDPNIEDYGIVENGVVASICQNPDCTSTKPNVLDHTFSVINGPLITGRQWKVIVVSLEKLLQKENIKLDQDIKVTAS